MSEIRTLRRGGPLMQVARVLQARREPCLSILRSQRGKQVTLVSNPETVRCHDVECQVPALLFAGHTVRTVDNIQTGSVSYQEGTIHHRENELPPNDCPSSSTGHHRHKIRARRTFHAETHLHGGVHHELRSSVSAEGEGIRNRRRR